MEAANDLLQLADATAQALAQLREPKLQSTSKAIASAAEGVGRAWSGSNIGYHATVYCHNLQPSPPHVQFSPEWGLMDRWPSHQPDPIWATLDHEVVVSETLRRAGSPDAEALEATLTPLRDTFLRLKEAAISALTAAVGSSEDKFIQRKLKQVDQLQVPNATTIIKSWLPSKMWSRDTLALSQGAQPAPHQCVAAIARAAFTLEGAFDQLERATREAGSHIRRTEGRQNRATMVGTNVFVGHGRSLLWRVLKDFLEDRLGLPVDEFNSVPVAGVSTTARLNELLDAAAFAFLIMTAEDEQADGKLNARLNVVHEVGLFQGRLGFTKAIVLLEEGCEEFSNIHGLGQIRFPKGNVAAAFEDVRAILEREGLIQRV